MIQQSESVFWVKFKHSLFVMITPCDVIQVIFGYSELRLVATMSHFSVVDLDESLLPAQSLIRHLEQCIWRANNPNIFAT
jgi:hypothetical protein